MCPIRACSALALVVALAPCESARLPFEAGVGASPKLPPPNPPLIPTVDIAPAEGWPAGAMPKPAERCR